MRSGCLYGTDFERNGKCPCSALQRLLYAWRCCAFLQNVIIANQSKTSPEFVQRLVLRGRQQLDAQMHGVHAIARRLRAAGNQPIHARRSSSRTPRMTRGSVFSCRGPIDLVGRAGRAVSVAAQLQRAATPRGNTARQDTSSTNARAVLPCRAACVSRPMSWRWCRLHRRCPRRQPCHSHSGTCVKRDKEEHAHAPSLEAGPRPASCSSQAVKRAIRRAAKYRHEDRQAHISRANSTTISDFTKRVKLPGPEVAA